MDLDDRIAFRFSYSTQKRDSENAKILYEAAMGGDKERAYNVLRNFPVVWKWFELIGNANNLSPEHPLVAEAYWHGNDLLDRNYDMKNIHDFIIKKFPKKFEGKIVPGVPIHPPHHNLHVFHYGIVSDPNADKYDERECLVRSLEMKPGLIGKNKRFVDEVNKVQNSFKLDIKEGSKVLVHRHDICSVVSDAEFDRLKKYGFDLQTY